MCIIALPPTDANLLRHIQRTHLHMILWKVADQQGPPSVIITNFGWTMKDGIPSPTISADPPAAPGLIDLLSCGCEAEDKVCSSTACS